MLHQHMWLIFLEVLITLCMLCNQIIIYLEYTHFTVAIIMINAKSAALASHRAAYLAYCTTPETVHSTRNSFWHLTAHCVSSTSETRTVCSIATAIRATPCIIYATVHEFTFT